jgi:hypothetical protein
MRAFLYLGFGMSLLFFLPLSLAENVAYSALVFFRGERRNTIRALLFGTLAVSLISTLVGFALIVRPPVVLSDLLGWAMASCWAWYFVLVPQAIIRKILFRGDTKTPPYSKLKMIFLRTLLTLVLPGALYLVHGILGYLFGMSSD